MKLSLGIIITNNFVLKCMALVLGIGLWLIISSLHTTTLWLEVPISFYNQHNSIVVAPETIQIQLSGYRSALQAIDLQTVALHIDASTLHEGKNPINITAHNLLLPDFISVVSYSPLNSQIELSTQ